MAKKQSMTILVTGATGHQGGAAAKHLREKGLSVRALTRDPNNEKARAFVGRGTEVVKGDLNDGAVYICKVRAVSCVTPVNSPQWTNGRSLLVGSAPYAGSVSGIPNRQRAAHTAQLEATQRENDPLIRFREVNQRSRTR